MKFLVGYLYLFVVVACIYSQVETSILVHCLVLGQRILGDHGTKLVALFLRSLRIFLHRPHHVAYIFIMEKGKIFPNKLLIIIIRNKKNI